MGARCDHRQVYFLDGEAVIEMMSRAGGRRERFVAKDVSVGKGQVGNSSLSQA